MKHSNFDGILEVIKKTELEEFREALKKHDGTYAFADLDELWAQRSGKELDDSNCPYISVTGGSTIHEKHGLVVHYVLLEDDQVIRVFGKGYQENRRSYSCEWEVEQGGWYTLMDLMNDPKEK